MNSTAKSILSGLAKSLVYVGACIACVQLSPLIIEAMYPKEQHFLVEDIFGIALGIAIAPSIARLKWDSHGNLLEFGLIITGGFTAGCLASMTGLLLCEYGLRDQVLYSKVCNVAVIMTATSVFITTTVGFYIWTILGCPMRKATC